MWLLPSEKTYKLHLSCFMLLWCTSQMMHKHNSGKKLSLNHHVTHFPPAVLQWWSEPQNKQQLEEEGGGDSTVSGIYHLPSFTVLQKKMFKALRFLASKITQGKYLKTPHIFPSEMQLNQRANSLHLEKRKTKPVSGIYHLPSRLDTHL